MLSFFRNIGRGIYNLYTWLPIIWADRQWDQHFLLRVIGKKLDLMEKHMRSDKCMASVHQDKYIKQVQTCKCLCKRIVEHDYLDNALTEHHKIYGNETRWHFEPVEGHPGCSKMVFDDTPKERASFRRAGKHSDIMEKQDYEMLFKIMSKYIGHWWD
jgi:hypothetical protein